MTRHSSNAHGVRAKLRTLCGEGRKATLFCLLVAIGAAVGTLWLATAVLAWRGNATAAAGLSWVLPRWPVLIVPLLVLAVVMRVLTWHRGDTPPRPPS